MIKILIVDDHQLIRTAFRSLIENVKGMTVLGEASSGKEAIILLRTMDIPPDVILMDLSMPNMDGLEATRELKNNFPDQRILIITASNDTLFASDLLKAGATSYVTKSSGPTHMIRAIQATYGGRRYISPDMSTEIALSNIYIPKGSLF